MTTAEPEQLLSVEEASERLRKTPAQLRWMIHNGSAPLSAKIGGRRMFRSSDIDAYIEAAFAAAAAERGDTAKGTSWRIR
ncbi:helix-turn-helix domain-containing protein [Leucobacter musarum]|uniref:helix-turn-helix domain-containing protein n=1 Tax=Leucobacter musarum TaxID=1930747 RepID=UPI001EFB48B3|nr:helix-turn-helix domain-containing protein [Leucobacter musarum]